MDENLLNLIEHMPLQQDIKYLNSLDILTAETLTGVSESQAVSALSVNSTFQTINVQNRLHVEGDIILTKPLSSEQGGLGAVITLPITDDNHMLVYTKDNGYVMKSIKTFIN